MYFKWTAAGIIIWLSWIDYCVYYVKPEDVAKSKKEVMEKLDYEDCGEMNEYVGCKIERRGDILKMTQPVLVQSLEDEFKFTDKTSDTLLVSEGPELT